MKKTIYIDTDDVLCDFKSAYEKVILENPSIKFPQSQYGFFRNLKPVKNSVKSVLYLHAQKNFEVYFLTAPSIRNPLCYTEKRMWIEDYFGLEMVNLGTGIQF